MHGGPPGGHIYNVNLFSFLGGANRPPRGGAIGPTKVGKYWGAYLFLVLGVAGLPRPGQPPWGHFFKYKN